MAHRAWRNPGGDGIDGAVLETGMAGSGEGFRSASGAGAVQRGARRAQIGLRRRVAAGPPVSRGGIKTELRAGWRAAELALFVAKQVSEETSPGAVAESDRSAAGREPNQTVERVDRSSGWHGIPHPEGAGQGRK